MKSPIKSKPLRNPGQSVDEYIHNYITEDVVPYLAVAVLSCALAVLEWFRWATSSPPNPWVYTVIALLATLYAVFLFIRARKKIRAFRQGSEGEKAVGQYLELLRERGAKVFHDIPGENFNLDHVVVDSSGIYVIETKTYSKPDKGHAIVTYDGHRVLLNGKTPKKNPIVQVTAASRWLRQTLKDSTGKDCTPRPVVVFPGWYVEPTAEAKTSDVWVLNPKSLPAFITKSKQQYSADEVKMFCYHLSRYVRAEGERAR